MKESYSFLPIKGEIERKKNPTEVQPLTVDEHDKIDLKPMTLKDHWLSLRQSIQEKLTVEKPTAEEQEKTKMLSELINPELVGEYKQILNDISEKTKKTEYHLQREFVDVNHKEFSDKIEDWIGKLISEVKSKKETGLDENDAEELRAQCWLFFDSIGNVMNTKSLEDDVRDFYVDKAPDENDKQAQESQRIELVNDLQSRYPMDKAEIEMLVDLIRSDDKNDKNYSPRLLVETISTTLG